MPGVRFSIVITSFNQCEFIKAAVDSALAQPPELREIIVVDDGSTDGSRELLERYHSAIRLIAFPSNRGAIEARNVGASEASGTYLIFLDGDDVLLPWALESYERVVRKREPKIILATHVWFNGSTPPPPEDMSPKRNEFMEFVEYAALMSKDRPFHTCASAMVIDRQAFLDVGGWTAGIFQMDTVDFTTKLGYSGRTILICSPACVLYRIHATNSVHAVPPFLRMAHRILAKERAGEYPGGLEHRFERHAWLGGVVFFWTKRALETGLYEGALRLAMAGWSLILAAIVRQAAVRWRGRQPLQVLEWRLD